MISKRASRLRQPHRARQRRARTSRIDDSTHTRSFHSKLRARARARMRSLLLYSSSPDTLAMSASTCSTSPRGVLEQDVSVHEPRGVAQTDEFHHFRQQRHDVDRADERGGQPQRRRRARGDVITVDLFSVSSHLSAMVVRTSSVLNFSARAIVCARRWVKEACARGGTRTRHRQSPPFASPRARIALHLVAPMIRNYSRDFRRKIHQSSAFPRRSSTVAASRRIATSSHLAHGRSNRGRSRARRARARIVGAARIVVGVVVSIIIVRRRRVTSKIASRAIDRSIDRVRSIGAVDRSIGFDGSVPSIDRSGSIDRDGSIAIEMDRSRSDGSIGVGLSVIGPCRRSRGMNAGVIESRLAKRARGEGRVEYAGRAWSERMNE